MSKIYIVTSGLYSDYCIEAVFSTEEKAKEYINIYGDYNNREIEEYEIDEENPERKDRVYKVYLTESSSETELMNCGEPIVDSFRFVTAFNGKLRCSFIVRADCSERAVKIARERLFQIKAMPYLYPLAKEECVGNKEYFYTIWNYPTYNYNTREIILAKGEFIKQ